MVTSVLQDKLSALGISISSPQGRLMDMTSSEDEHDDGNQAGSHSLTWSDDSLSSPITTPPSFFPVYPTS